MTSERDRVAIQTSMAWQRTALSAAAGSAIVARLTFGEVGLVALLALAVVLGLCLWLALDLGLGGRSKRLQSAVASAVLSLAVAAIAVIELVALLGPG